MSNDLPDHPNLPELDPDEVLDREVIQPPAAVNENSLVRRVALQILYEIDSAGHPIGEVMSQQMAYYALSERGADYLRLLVRGVLNKRRQLDAVISYFAPEWPVAQLAIIDRNVLRLAIFEMHVEDQPVPVKVVIDEAVELAKWFGAEGSTRFVNGVLGAVVEDTVDIGQMLNMSSGTGSAVG
ncbi:MAG: transcription antitermination factor NusB [Anaerolineaceae bacterium]|nr:MAG: transcription antitermination factor NusB [Anaerolineaceae bacterium]